MAAFEQLLNQEKFALGQQVIRLNLLRSFLVPKQSGKLQPFTKSDLFETSERT
jgi:hypothetical protein